MYHCHHNSITALNPTTINLSTWSKVRSKTTQRPKISSYQELPCTGPHFLALLPPSFIYAILEIMVFNFSQMFLFWNLLSLSLFFFSLFILFYFSIFIFYIVVKTVCGRAILTILHICHYLIF